MLFWDVTWFEFSGNNFARMFCMYKMSSVRFLILKNQSLFISEWAVSKRGLVFVCCISKKYLARAKRSSMFSRWRLCNTVLLIFLSKSVLAFGSYVDNFPAPNCTPGELLSDFPGSDYRIMSMAFHRVRPDANSDGVHDETYSGEAYLLESVHGASSEPCLLKIWDVSDVRKPRLVDRYPTKQEAANGAKHFCGWRWAQTSLEYDRASSN